MGKKDRAYVLSVLENMAFDLEEVLGLVSDTDEWTLGELKRLSVLAGAVRDGASSVRDEGVHPLPADPSLSVASRNPSTPNYAY